MTNSQYPSPGQSVLFDSMRNSLPGNVWPVVPNVNAATILALLAQLELSQWQDQNTLLELQMRQLDVLIRFASVHVPYYRTRFPDLDIINAGPMTSGLWSKIPILLRADIQRVGNDLQATALPSKDHMPLNKIQTSGSTGMPIVAFGTAITRLFWNVISMRDHLWHKRNMMGKLVSIRPEITVNKQSLEFDSWGDVINKIYRTGKSAVLNSSTAVDKQALWLQVQQPEYLLSLPTNIKEIVRYFHQHDLRMPGLKEVRTYGEVVDDEVHALVKECWNLPVHDMYSCQEAGFIALQCNEFGNYHVQSESLLVEILDDQGNACKPGEMGRVVITTLHNFAMPLIRYALGDYAVAGEPCACGRGLPVIQKIFGRERNMVTLPTGQRHYPSFPAAALTSVAPVRQFQLVQKSLEVIEMRLVMDRELSANEQSNLIQVLQERLRYPFTILISYHDKIARSKGGKFEDFISEVTF